MPPFPFPSFLRVPLAAAAALALIAGPAQAGKGKQRHGADAEEPAEGSHGSAAHGSSERGSAHGSSSRRRKGPAGDKRTAGEARSQAVANSWPTLSEYRSNYLGPIRQARTAGDRANSGLRQLGVQESSNEYRRLASDDPDAFNRRSAEMQRRREQLTREREQADQRVQAACDRYQQRHDNLAGQGGRTSAQSATLRGMASDLQRYCSRRASR